MISLAHFPEDREDIIRLWSVCFGDARQYIEFFLDNLPSENVLFVYKIEENIAGMFFLMPANFRYMAEESMQQWQIQPVYYVYAVGVAPGYRKHGIAGRMLEFAKAYAYERGAELFLVPASKTLVSYYGARGFELLKGDAKTLHAAKYGDLVAKVNIENMAVLSNIACEKRFDRCIEMLYRKREEALQSECALLWSMDNFKFAIKEHTYTGGLVYVSEIDNFNGFEYAIYEQKVEGLRIREALSEGEIFGNIDVDIMITTMSYGNDFNEVTVKTEGAYINFCFE